MISWFMSNKLLGGAIIGGVVLFSALGVQTWRVSSLKSDVAIYKKDLAAYEQALYELEENAARREDALLRDFAREKIDYEKMLQAIKNTYMYNNMPLPNGIIDTINELYDNETSQDSQN